MREDEPSVALLAGVGGHVKEVLACVSSAQHFLTHKLIIVLIGLASLSPTRCVLCSGKTTQSLGSAR